MKSIICYFSGNLKSLKDSSIFLKTVANAHIAEKYREPFSPKKFEIIENSPARDAKFFGEFFGSSGICAVNQFD